MSMASQQTFKKAIAIVSRNLPQPFAPGYSKKVACFFAIALALWSTGFGCVVCCASYSSDSCCVSNGNTSNPSASFIPATPNAYSDEHSCCKRPEHTQGEAFEKPA